MLIWILNFTLNELTSNLELIWFCVTIYIVFFCRSNSFVLLISFWISSVVLLLLVYSMTEECWGDFTTKIIIRSFVFCFIRIKNIIEDGCCYTESNKANYFIPSTNKNRL